MCSACDTLESGRGARALVRFRHAHAKIRWLFRALLPAAHVAPTVSLHTLFVDSSVSKKRHQRATLLASAVFLTALQLPSCPVHRWRAWLLSFGSLDAKSPSTIFLASWAKTRQENQIIFFCKIVLGKCWVSASNSPKTLSYGKSKSDYRVDSFQAKQTLTNRNSRVSKNKGAGLCCVSLEGQMYT
jgi:hypothetical protein